MDAEWGLYHMRRALWDPVDPRLLGSIAPGFQFRVNGEVYRFGSERTMLRFVRHPPLWCGLLRDPVTGNRFLPSLRSPEAWWAQGPYYFESDSTKAIFVSDPPRYQVIRRM